jgi:NAD(P)-dependent dehydrogenase (short-subunit alcohol dehydrogenase family)
VFEVADRALGPREIRVTAVHPGPIERAMDADDRSLFDRETIEAYRERNPLGSAATTEDVANAVLVRASEYASCVDGESLILGGGAYDTNDTATDSVWTPRTRRRLRGG